MVTDISYIYQINLGDKSFKKWKKDTN